MPDLLASTSLLPLTPAIPGRTPSIAAPIVVDFMAMLGDLVLSPGGKAQGGKGQGLAGDGKSLPVEGAPVASDEDETDPLVAWLPAGLVPLAPIEPASLPDAAFVAAPPLSGTKATVVAPMADAGSPAMLPGSAETLAQKMDAQVLVSVAETAPVIPEPPVIDPVLADAPAGEVMLVEGDIVDPRGKTEMPMREALLRPAPAHAATPQSVIRGATAAPTAAQVFAAAISASFDSPTVPALRATDPVALQAQAAATEQLRTTVQAMSGADQAPLDLSRDDWAGKMVDRIAAMRDAVEVADTRIRLAPENLGNVDVSIRRDGDRLHVHFAAENAATRQLLAEAAPRLAELADARGLKLGQTSVDAGAGGQRQDAQPQPNQPARPVSVMASDMQSDRDDRVA